MLGDKNRYKVGMDDHLWDTHVLEGLVLNELQQDKLKDHAHNIDTFFKSLKSTSTTPLFGNV